MKLKLTDFETICKELDDMKECSSNIYNPDINEVDYAVDAVKKYVGKERKKLSKLRAEGNSIDVLGYHSLYFEMNSHALSTFGIFATMSGFGSIVMKDINDILFMIFFSVALLLFMCIVTFFGIKPFLLIRKFSFIRKWKPYVLVAIDEYEKMLKKPKKK